MCFLLKTTPGGETEAQPQMSGSRRPSPLPTPSESRAARGQANTKGARDHGGSQGLAPRPWWMHVRGAAGAAGKSSDLASRGQVQNNQPHRPARTRPGARRPLGPGRCQAGYARSWLFLGQPGNKTQPPGAPKEPGQEGQSRPARQVVAPRTHSKGT